ncbi:relaxase/mobilization nuclease domain-containing protein [[Flexibacter] sp. ATCC 35208]|uniref:relaxase/mobilization nuclease domain-containing protein n=1 Tax=[Flexibacter] sp. ATCC 35208 TaxID=1936242 RepID=UPI0009D30440|nr:relaxase/mobilization nuclease domain-containing protein [[Flexibacter] sp. ATCC 35208]OMP74964.1 relaxase [[Flexibacter] sp. ATCC 35208]
MIGHVSIGASFYHCISYCLEDKREFSEEQKLQLSLKDNLQHKNRAEVLFYNKCFGDKYELTNDFKDVRKLSKRVEKPVLHLSLRLAPGEMLTKDQLTEIGRECATEFGVADNQYICVLHKDTNEQHIHIAANRVGFDGKVASDSNSYKRMAALCRRLEKQYKLQEVLSPRAFLSPQDRLLPRQDMRKEKLRTNIRQTLEKVHHYSEFEQKMQALGYKVIKGRGISFVDDKKVKIKGSEVGFSLATIEKVLHLKSQLKIKQAEEKAKQPEYQQHRVRHSFTPTQRMLQTVSQTKEWDKSPVAQIQKEISNLLYQILKPEQSFDYINPELLKEAKRKKKKKFKMSL